MSLPLEQRIVADEPVNNGDRDELCCYYYIRINTLTIRRNIFNVKSVWSYDITDPLLAANHNRIILLKLGDPIPSLQNISNT